MAEAVLSLRVNPETGKRVLAVDYLTDADALPAEHEEEHKLLAAKVLEGGLNNQKVTVTREQDNTAPSPGQTAQAPQRTPQGQT
jgi:hypothetical protein